MAPAEPRDLELYRLFFEMQSGAPYERVLSKVRAALKRGSDPKDQRGRVLYLFSARDRKGKIVQELLRAGADPNIGCGIRYLLDDPYLEAVAGQYYPLHAAVCARLSINVRSLLMAGAKVNVYGRGLEADGSSFSGTPLAALANLPLKTQSGSLSSADAERRDIQIAGLLLQAGADIHWSRPGERVTPLHYSAMAGKPRVAAYLIKRGASKKRLSGGKLSPFDLARVWHPKNKELLRVLDFPGRKAGPPPGNP